MSASGWNQQGSVPPPGGQWGTTQQGADAGSRPVPAQAPGSWGQAAATGQWGAAQAPVGAALRLNLKPALWSGFMTSPGVSINGTPVVAQWGDNVYPVAPGRYRLEAKVNYIFPMGQVFFDVDVPQGSATQVYYAGPAGVFFSGAIGLTPQRSSGQWLTWVSLGIAGAILLLMFVGIILSAILS